MTRYWNNFFSGLKSVTETQNPTKPNHNPFSASRSHNYTNEYKVTDIAANYSTHQESCIRRWPVMTLNPARLHRVTGRNPLNKFWSHVNTKRTRLSEKPRHQMTINTVDRRSNTKSNNAHTKKGGTKWKLGKASFVLLTCVTKTHENFSALASSAQQGIC